MPASRVQVLLVEDDRDDYILTRDLLADIPGNHYALDWVSDYTTALDTMRRRQHDVCLVDYRLGPNNGLELIQEAKQAGVQMPMILLTGQGEHEVDLKAMRAGAADFLVKGQINPTFLERSLRYALERARTQAEIQRLAAFARHNPYPVMEFGSNGAVLYFNDAARKMADQVGFPSPVALLPPNVEGIVRDCLATGQNKVQLQSRVGSHTLSWSFFPVPGSGVVHCYATDLTERLALEAQLRHAQKMEAVGQLAAGIAHDFNNILTIIEGHAALLAGGFPPQSPCARPLREIRQAAERAGTLIRQLLMFSRKQVLQPRPVNLNQIIESAIAMLERAVGEHVRVQVLTAPDLRVIRADPLALEQLLTNLAVNARDAMPKGGVLLVATRNCRLTPEDARRNAEARPGEFVCLTVSDTGCGMSPETLSRIFEPFFTTKGVGKGTGLGLASVYGIVKQHKGWIEVRSELGRGTVFEIYLPVTDQRPEPTSPQPPATIAAPHGSETILVVEDEPALRELVVEILQCHGYRVFSAGTGAEALDIWTTRGHEIDLLVTDMVMPGLMGRELAERLQRDRPSLKVIYTSGYSPGMAGRDLRLLEGFNFLPKPYPPSKLAHLVRECLDQRIPSSAGPRHDRDHGRPGALTPPAENPLSTARSG